MTDLSLKDVPGDIRRVLRKVDFKGKIGDDNYKTYEEPVIAKVSDANVVTSEAYWGEDTHAPVFDLDFEAQLVPSTTPGHFHLYLDREVTWEAYVKVLDAMKDAGILEKGYVEASKQRGYTAVRLPWIQKENEKKDQEEDEIPF